MFTLWSLYSAMKGLSLSHHRETNPNLSLSHHREINPKLLVSFNDKKNWARTCYLWLTSSSSNMSNKGPQYGSRSFVPCRPLFGLCCYEIQGKQGTVDDSHMLNPPYYGEKELHRPVSHVVPQQETANLEDCQVIHDGDGESLLLLSNPLLGERDVDVVLDPSTSSGVEKIDDIDQAVGENSLDIVGVGGQTPLNYDEDPLSIYQSCSSQGPSMGIVTELKSENKLFDAEGSHETLDIHHGGAKGYKNNDASVVDLSLHGISLESDEKVQLPVPCAKGHISETSQNPQSNGSGLMDDQPNNFGSNEKSSSTSSDSSSCNIFEFDDEDDFKIEAVQHSQKYDSCSAEKGMNRKMGSCWKGHDGIPTDIIALFPHLAIKNGKEQLAVPYAKGPISETSQNPQSNGSGLMDDRRNNFESNEKSRGTSNGSSSCIILEFDDDGDKKETVRHNQMSDSRSAEMGHDGILADITALYPHLLIKNGKVRLPVPYARGHISETSQNPQSDGSSLTDDQQNNFGFNEKSSGTSSDSSLCDSFEFCDDDFKKKAVQLNQKSDSSSAETDKNMKTGSCLKGHDGIPTDIIALYPRVAIKKLQIIRNSDLEYIKELGHGRYGTVYHGKWKVSDIAIKRMKPSCSSNGAKEDQLVADFWKEALTLSQLRHPNIVAVYGVVTDGPVNCLATITEYMANGSLKQVLRKEDRKIDPQTRLIIAMDAAFGMEYLHGKNIVHFDLKSRNFLVDMRDPQRPVCKIGDLGLSRVKQRTLLAGGIRRTIPWIAPEILGGRNLVSEKVDVFSFGIVMWELLTCEEPYANMRSEEIIAGIITRGNLRPEIPSWCDPSWRSLMERCWSSNPDLRPSFTEIAKELRAMAASMNIE